MSTMLPGRVVQMADKAMEMMGVSPKAEQAANTSTTKYKEDPSGSKMTALHWHGNKSVSVEDCPKPAITDEKDVVVKITSTAICGSDLHLFLGAVPGMRNGQVLGHEPMGIVESVGPAVTKIKPGDRVVVAFCLACGECAYCMAQLYSSCDCTNPSITEEKLMGARTSGLLGHPELMGGYAGGQAEYLRVPFGEVNCLVIPPETNLPDDKVLFLSDILSTAWHGTELAFVGPGDVVAIWGCGPVGILTAQCAFTRGAKRVIIVDSVAYRLEFAKKVLPRIETVDFTTDKTSAGGEKKVLELCQNEPFGAPDCCIECVGMHYAHSAVHRVEMAVGMETDSPEALNACILACRKGGRIGLIGAYAGFSNHVMIGAFMEKCLSMRSGQTPVHKYWKDLLEKVKNGTLDPSVVITHHLPLRDAAKGYQIFNDKMDNVIKIVLKPDGSAATA